MAVWFSYACPVPYEPASTLVYAGIDEAGYGPRLGPLCVGMSVFRAPVRCDPLKQRTPPDLWRLLAPTITREGKGFDRGRIPIADSKQLKLPNDSTTRHPWERLEPGVLAMLALVRGETIATDIEVMEGLGVCLDAEGCYGGLALPSPQSLPADRLSLLTASLRSASSRAGVDALDLACIAMCERRFNEQLALQGVKSDVNFDLVGSHLRKAFATWGGERLLVAVDRQGGRRFYANALGALFPEADIHTLNESTSRSLYRVQESAAEAANGEPKSMTVLFQVKADDSHFPTALASMTAKLVREIAMARFNQHFGARLPELKPTAGYGADARRWLVDAASILSPQEREAIVRQA